MEVMNMLAGMNCHYIRHSLDYFLDKMAGLGIRNIELWGASPHFYVPDCGAGDALRVRRKIEERNINLICFTPEQVTYPVNIAARESGLRRRSVDYYLKAVRLCGELGTEQMLLTPGWGYLDEPEAEALKRSVTSVGEIAKQAEREGVTLLLEHLTPASSNLINRADDLRRMCREISSPALKAMADTVQVQVAGEEIEKYFDDLGEGLRHIHIADGTPGGHLALGDGTIPLKQMLDVITGRGYSGYLTMEIADRRYFAKPEEADRRSLQWMLRYTGEEETGWKEPLIRRSDWQNAGKC